MIVLQKGEKRGLIDRLHIIPDLLHKVQDTLEMIVVTGERLKKYVRLISFIE
jgi:hypothetical protein